MKEVDVASIKTTCLEYGNFKFSVSSNCTSLDHPDSLEVSVDFSCKVNTNSQFFIVIVVPNSNKRNLDFHMTYPSDLEPHTTSHEIVPVVNYEELTSCVSMIIGILGRVYGQTYKELHQFNSPLLSIISILFFEVIGFSGIGNEPH